MKETKEDQIFKIENNEEASLFKSIATGRKFFKKGERVIDICDQEIERYKYEKSILLTKLFYKLKLKNRKEKYMLENRTSSVIRSTAAYCIRENEEDEIDSIMITNEVKNYILKIVEEYYEKDKIETKIIDIKTKSKKEVS